MPCHIALPEISETFGQSGHITHLLAGEAASHTPQVPEPDDEFERSARPVRKLLLGAMRPGRSQCYLACSAWPGRNMYGRYVD
jgi:hypothetical protein